MTNNINIPKNPEQDATFKRELKELAESVDIWESNFESINNLFEKINELDESNKQKALQYALYESNIKAGNGTIKLLEIAKIFEENIEQIDNTWKIKAKEDAELGEKSELIEKLLNEKESPFAYLIQKSAQLITLHAARGYGAESKEKLAIWIDKIFGNQTRRALEWLKDWVESDLDTPVEEIDVASLTIADILNMKFISKKLKEKIELEWNNNIKKLWESEKYQYLRPYTNNYALKNKNVEGTNEIEGTEEVKENNENLTEPLTEEDIKLMEKINNEVMKTIIDQLKESFGSSFSIYNYKNPIINIIQTKKIEYQNSYWSKSEVTHACSCDFNIRKYFNEDQTLNIVKLKEDFNKEAEKIIVERKKELEENAIKIEKKAIQDENHKEIYELRKKRYSLTDIYGKDSNKTQNIGYITFFNSFPENKIRFHQNNYFYIVNDHITFDFDQKGQDKNFVTNIKIPLSEFTDENHKIKEENFFIEALWRTIDNIVEKHYSV